MRDVDLRHGFRCEALEPRTLLAAIVSNTTTPGTISVRGEVDSYEFDAAAGERIILSLGEVTASYEPYLELHGPDGALVANGSGAGGALVEAVAPATGSYSARVFEFGSDETGDYLLHFVKLPHPGAAAADPFDGDGGTIASDTTTPAAIDTVGDFDTYFIDAAAGDRLIASVGEVTAAYEAYFALYGPNGARINTGSGANSALIESVAPSQGRYALVVFEFGNDETGEYLLHFARLPHAGAAPNVFDGDGGVLASNTTAAASVDAAGDFDVYTFDATAGERVVLSLAEASPAYEPYVALYGPTGALVGTQSAAIASFLETVATVTGTYNVLVFEFGNDEPGDYQLHFLKLPHVGPALNPFDGDGAALVSNTTTAASLEAAGDLDLYSIQAVAGERIVLSLGEATPALEPYLALYGPTGAVVGSHTAAIGALVDVVAPATGTYNVLVADYGDDEAGDYRLHYAKLPHAGPATDPFDGDGAVLTRTGTTTSAIDAPGDFDLYLIPAVAGEQLALFLTEGAATPEYEPYMELYAPGGTQLANNSGAAAAAIGPFTSTSGTYALLVFDYGDDEAGDYALRFVRVATVVGRMFFYNNSYWDTAGDDAAIAPDKTARLPGQAPVFANVTSFSKGINGIMADVATLPGETLSAQDFVFRAGTDPSPANWAAAPAPASVAVRKGAGAGGADRVDITWPDNAIKNQWLQVTMLANDATSLLAANVFYFGSLVGDTGDSALRVNALDLATVKRALNSAAPVGGREDMNRDGRVNALDLATVRANLNRTLGAITTAAPLPIALPPPAVFTRKFSDTTLNNLTRVLAPDVA